MRLVVFLGIALSACRPVGAPCESAGECRSAPIPECTEWPGGYCSGRCDRDADCGPLGACIARDDDPGGVCLVRCDAAHGCRDGYRCRGTMDGWNVCLPE